MKKELFIFTALIIFSLLFLQCKVKSETEASSTDIVTTYYSTIAQDTTTVENAYLFPSEVRAAFPGGDMELICFIDENIDKELLNSIDTSGKTYVQFTVDSLGQIRDVEVVKSLNTLVDNELMRVVDLMPNWTPASLFNGKTVEVKMIMPLQVPYENKCVR